MGSTNWGELFPGRWSFVIFITYMALFVNQGIIVTWSQTKGHYEYNTVIVVLATEILKLIVSAILYCYKNKPVELAHEIIHHKNEFDPTTYYILLQFRVVVTGIIFQLVFKKYLSMKQWISLFILTIGCMVKHIHISQNSENFETNFHININIIFIVIQVICSCLAGVYNEYLLKGKGANINIFLQNIFMYFDSIICNIIAFVILINVPNSFAIQFNNNNHHSIFTQPKIILIMINNAAVGIITSFFLKNLNSILKTFASALELVFTAILCWIIFHIPIYSNTIISIAMVSYAVVLYSQNPVINIKPEKDIEEEENLV
ncbi:UDP-galactose transporter senju isoform X2 [Prorops nasuta]|uniref:UDP-galactose transporter senju isoform X2 n=1 Tax=Prorops nasuta TaxID=863751 RepID=UPI0034CD499D